MPTFLSRTSKSFRRPSSTASSQTRRSDADSVDDSSLDQTGAALHPEAHPDGGLACTNALLMKAQRSAIVEVLKGLGKKLLTGQLDLLKLSLPVKIFEPRSYLEKLADPWVYPQFLDMAAAATDPLSRLQLVITYFVAGYHLAFSTWRKPFNPILGETWQAVMPDGSHIFLEQISHHPPVSAYQLFGPRGRYEYAGSSEPAVTYTASGGVVTSSKGRRVMRFPDGGAITVEYPTYELKGLIGTGTPRALISGTARFVDEGNGLAARLQFGPLDEVSAATDPLFRRCDALCGVIRAREPRDGGALEESSLPLLRADAEGPSLTGRALRSLSLSSAARSEPGDDVTTGWTPVSACRGNWLAFLDWDGRRAWTLADDPHGAWQPEPVPLPSDCRFRLDLAMLKSRGGLDAQAAKEELENAQRADAKLRKSGLKP